MYRFWRELRTIPHLFAVKCALLLLIPPFALHQHRPRHIFSDFVEMPSLDADEQAIRVNEFGQPIGVAVKSWTPPPFPPHKTLTGRYCQLEPLQAARHAGQIWDALDEVGRDARWTYMPYGPFAGFEDYEKWCANAEQSRDPQFYAIVVDGKVVGVISYLRIDPNNGAIEVGHVLYSPLLVQTRAATEAQYLLATHAFELGYRRYEWKCDSCNRPSCNAATRLGFSFEGIFRQAVVYKGRNRDTSWFSVTDGDWNTGLKDAFVQWLEPSNFDDIGKQKLKLSDLTAPFVHARS